MENKATYTLQEVEDAVLAYGDYLNQKSSYAITSNVTRALGNQDKELVELEKEELNQSVDECNQKLPKSLINKLNINKV